MSENIAKKIMVTIDGEEHEVPANLSILQALREIDIEVPNLCYDVRMEHPNGSCGLCMVEVEGAGDVRACQTPIAEGMKIITKSDALSTYRKMRLEQLLADHNGDCVAPCVNTCPAHIDIQSYLQEVKNGNYEQALRIIKNNNPFPSACGRVCPHTCEGACRRNLVDEPVAINNVKRFTADLDAASAEHFVPEVAEPSGKKIAIVGAGPSGLSAAYYSAIKGHEVTVFEKEAHSGGMMRYGIPEYRLPKAILDKEIGTITELGVKIVNNKALGKDITLSELQDDFDTVYLALGSWKASPLKIEGENSPGVMLGIHYLEKVTNGEKLNLGKRVVVIGGGNTAIDCVRTARRQGASEVKLIYRRTRAEMPAEEIEIEEALAEGVEMVFLTAPLKISDGADGKELLCTKMALGEPDKSGRRRPIPVEGSEFVIKADTIIGAIGQATDTAAIAAESVGVELTKWGDIVIDGATMQSSNPKIFAGGDCVTGPATVIAAVGAGKRAAEAMDSFLKYGVVAKSQEDYSCSRGSLEDLPRWEFEPMPKMARVKYKSLPMCERLKDFSEVDHTISAEEARREAERCLKCGCAERESCNLRKLASKYGVEYHKPLKKLDKLPILDDHPFIVRDSNKCIACGRCVTACAELEGPGVLALTYQNGREIVTTKSGKPLSFTDCVGCGQCVNSCPCGALDYKRERGKVFRAINNPDMHVVGFVAPAVRSYFAEALGLSYDKATPIIAGLMRKLGFDSIFDFTFTADLTIVEEASEFLERVQKGGVLPQFTSCCPGWVNFAEKRYPEILPHLSSCKSPQQMMGAVVKNHFAKRMGITKDKLFVVSVVPCIAKKGEAARPEFAPDGIRDVDAVLTSKELLEMAEKAMIDPHKVAPAEFDTPYKEVSGAGVIFGNSGGVAEAALRMAVEKLSGEELKALDFKEVRGFTGLKAATYEVNGQKVRVAVASGLKNIEPVIKKIIAGEDSGYDLIEVMACRGGCICGAGNGVPKLAGDQQKRADVLTNLDEHGVLRKSQDNPDIKRLYEEYFKTPGSELAHHLLHTKYAKKQGDSTVSGLVGFIPPRLNGSVDD